MNNNDDDIKRDAQQTSDNNDNARDETSAPEQTSIEGDERIEREIKRRSRRGFLVGGVATLAAIGGWEWLRTRPEEDDVAWPLRRALRFNERASRAYFSGGREVATYSGTGSEMPRANGEIGLDDEDFDPASWRLRVNGLAPHKPGGKNAALELTLDDIKRLPRVEYTTYLKCIEGWSDMAHWAGARFVDFAGKYAPATKSGEPFDLRARPGDLLDYVKLATPDDEYYVGLDTASAMHPQTLLVYEMGGKPLTSEHGAPLRLFTPVKYGIKNLKRIGTISFTDERPPDYWAEQGYDYYAGH